MAGTSYVQWWSIGRVAMQFDFSADRVRRWWRAGFFGPDDGRHWFVMGRGTGSDVRISSIGVQFFLANHTHQEREHVVSARSAGEARRALEVLNE